MLVRYLKSFRRFLLDLESYLLFRIYYESKVKYSKINSHDAMNLINGVTVVVTSCNRTENLITMLQSFTKYNTAKIEEIILVEDGGSIRSIEVAKEILNLYNLKTLYHQENKGQLQSIDEAYELVKTKYIFHLEEDWVFTKSGFIEYSVDIFNNNKDICCLSLRPHEDWRKNKLVPCDNFYKIIDKHSLIWGGTGINPGLYRTEYYNFLGDYKRYNKERIITQAYSSLGYFGAVSNEKNGFLYHDGQDNSTRRQGVKVA